jgi:hypothetical protein
MQAKLTLLIFLATILVGCAPSPQTSESTPVPAAPKEQSGSAAASEFAEVAAAIKLGQAARCTLTNTAENQSMEYVIKGKKMKMHASAIATSMPETSMLTDGEFLYTWTEKDKKGMKMRVPTPEETKQMKDTTHKLPDFSQESEKQRYENLGYTINCALTTAADSEFIPPADVTFTDLSAMMKPTE